MGGTLGCVFGDGLRVGKRAGLELAAGFLFPLGVGLFLRLLDLRLKLVPFLLIFFGFDLEMLFADGLAADAGIPDQQRVYHHLVMPGRHVGVVRVAAGDLQGIEQESGFLVVDLLGRMRRMTCMTAAWMELPSSRTGKSAAPALHWPRGLTP